MRVTTNRWVLLALLLAPVWPRAADPASGRPPDAAGGSADPQYTVRADLGGTEPGTSRQAFEAVIARRAPSDLYELQVGYTYTDQVYFTSNRGYATLYRFFNDGRSYVKGDATLRKYDYPIDATVRKPNPDSNAYEWVPRGELEVSHWLAQTVRAGVQYQLFPASFFYDTSSWTVNQKLAGDVEVRPFPVVSLGVKAAVLRDPDPDRTEILGRQVPGAPAGTLATATSVVYRTTSLVGGWGGLELPEVGVKLEYLPNRDLDNSYDWSLLSTLDLRPARWVELRLQQVHDTYSSLSNFPGKTADIYMGAAVFRATEVLRLRAGYRYVDAPAGARSGGTVIAGVEWRPRRS